MRPRLFFIALFISLAESRVTFPYSEVIQLKDLVNNEAPFNCPDGCKIYVDRADDNLLISKAETIITNFTNVRGNTTFPDVYGFYLEPSSDYTLLSKCQTNADFVFYAVSKKAPEYGGDVYVADPGHVVTVNMGGTRYQTIITSFKTIIFAYFRGDYTSSYPRIYSTGSDVAGDTRCNPLYQAKSRESASRSTISVYSPIATYDAGQNGYSINAGFQFHATNIESPAVNDDSSTVFMSPGYVGCEFVGSQVYHSPKTDINEKFTQAANSLNISAVYNDVSYYEPIELRVNKETLQFWGTSSYIENYAKDSFHIELSWNRTSPCSSWAMQLDFGIPPVEPTSTTRTTPRATTTIPTTTTTRTTTTTTRTTTTTVRPTTTNPATTTAPAKSTSAYCNCNAKFGIPVGWNFNEIWVDIVIILDTSEAMGANALGYAEELIESFLSDGFEEYLITDTTKNFYSRVGVITMDDTAKTVYNLNMTKSDSLQGKASIKKGVKSIDVVKAFDVAKDMLNDGLKSEPERATARQVVYYMTDSNPVLIGKSSFDSIDAFKASQGVIIVNSFLKEGESDLPASKDLASPGYYFSNGDYVTAGLQAFCKANCFCAPDQIAYGNDDPAIQAPGGCYRSTPTGVPFNKGKSTCASGGGFLATIHDDQKGLYLQQLMASTKSDYFWIGYEKADNGSWTWEDGSTDPYTKWDEDEPSTASVAKCAYSSKLNLAWGAGNCNAAFPHVCQYSPCAVGNKDC